MSKDRFTGTQPTGLGVFPYDVAKEASRGRLDDASLRQAIMMSDYFRPLSTYSDTQSLADRMAQEQTQDWT